MDQILVIGKFVMAHWVEIVAAISGFLTSAIVLFTFIPGEQPEKAMQSIVDFVARFSSKPKV